MGTNRTNDPAALDLAHALACLDALVDAEDFEGETLRLILRLAAAWNRRVLGAVNAEIKALCLLWGRTPGQGAMRRRLNRDEANAVIYPNTDLFTKTKATRFGVPRVLYRPRRYVDHSARWRGTKAVETVILTLHRQLPVQKN